MLVHETNESIKQLNGFVKAVALETDKIYIELQNIDHGISLVEEELERMGFSFRYSTLTSATDLLPLSIRIASLLAIKKVFQLNDTKIIQMGRLSTKSSFFTKLVLRYLVSLNRMAKEIPRHWQRHYTVGSMDPGEVHENERYFLVRLHDFPTNTIFCTYLSGYIIGMVELIGNYSDIAVEELKCQQRGDAFHEFKITWK